MHHTSKTLWYGSAYCPEHWPEERWSRDAAMMQAGGFNVVRIGAFAWCRMEPELERFEFGWMDRAIDTLNAQGVQVMIGTPTVGPPAWLVNAEERRNEAAILLDYDSHSSLSTVSPGGGLNY